MNPLRRIPKIKLLSQGDYLACMVGGMGDEAANDHIPVFCGIGEVGTKFSFLRICDMIDPFLKILVNLTAGLLPGEYQGVFKSILIRNLRKRKCGIFKTIEV